jgi:hypothetical protein
MSHGVLPNFLIWQKQGYEVTMFSVCLWLYTWTDLYIDELEHISAAFFLNFSHRRMCLYLCDYGSMKVILTDGQSASLSLYQATIWNRPTTSFSFTSVVLILRHLRFSYGGAPSSREGVCNLLVQVLLGIAGTIILGSVLKSSWPYLTVPFEARIPFCRLLRLAVLLWRFSSPPTQGLVGENFTATNNKPLVKLTTLINACIG